MSATELNKTPGPQPRPGSTPATELPARESDGTDPSSPSILPESPGEISPSLTCSTLNGIIREVPPILSKGLQRAAGRVRARLSFSMEVSVQ